ncbi:MAG: NADH-quinone oxidoreductase subunit C [Candidatus Hydrogenedentes bacterium]|nr:NADH-quinone oxidoreductase subunit C [Candidatus Hydrogenedentota bacterium]
MDPESLLALVETEHPSIRRRSHADRPAVSVPSGELLAVMTTLRDHADLRFDLLLTLTAVDFPGEDRFELLYRLYSTVHGLWLIVSSDVPRSRPVAPSVSSLWPIAEWQEREAYDLMGVLYDNHPDLRRVFLEDDWVGYPLRKDYQDEYMLELPK